MAEADQILENFSLSLASRGGISIKFNQKIDEKPPADELPIPVPEDLIRESFSMLIDP